MADEVRINGNAVSWGSIKVKIDNEPYFKFDSISYGDSVERVKYYGLGAHHAPVARSRGKYTTDPVKLRGLKTTFQAMREALASRSSDGRSYGNVEITIVAQYVEAGNNPITAEILGCVWVKNVDNNEESPDPLKEEVEFDCMKILRNGLTLFDSNGEPAP
jgi:hypothetical protein